MNPYRFRPFHHRRLECCFVRDRLSVRSFLKSFFDSFEGLRSVHLAGTRQRVLRPWLQGGSKVYFQ